MNAPGTIRPARRGERGFVLLFAAITGLLAMGLWVQAWRATHDEIRTETFAVARDLRADSLVPALAEGARLLRTGRPPSDPYQCIISIIDGSDVHDCTLTFTAQTDPLEFLVQAAPSTSAEQSSLPTAPTTFGS